MDCRILVVDRETKQITYNFICSKWSIESDILTTSQSSFELPLKDAIKNLSIGDFIIVKSYGERFKPTNDIDRHGFFNCLYIGIVDSFESKKITARPLNDMYNISVPLPILWKGDNPGEFISNFSYEYVFTKDRYLDNIHIYNNSELVSGWNVIQDKPKVFNLIGILQSLYKTTGFFIDTLGYKYDSDTKEVSFAFFVDNNEDVSDNIFLSRNVYFKTTKFYIRPENTANANALDLLYNGIHYHYYLRLDGGITDDYEDELVMKPVSKQGYIYDSPAKTETKNSDGTVVDKPTEVEPTPIDIASRELKTSEYQHEIEFSMSESYPVVEKLMNLGAKVNINYDGKMYPSSITKIHVDSDSTFVTLTCGNIRSTMQFALDELTN